jgi:hypothetical protein
MTIRGVTSFDTEKGITFMKSPRTKNIQSRRHPSTNREKEIREIRTHPSIFTPIFLLKIHYCTIIIFTYQREIHPCKY